MDCGVVALVMSRERCLPVLKALKSSDIDILAVENCQQARELLQTHRAMEVIITQVTLAVGNSCKRVGAQHGSVQSAEVISPCPWIRYLFQELTLRRSGYE